MTLRMYLLAGLVLTSTAALSRDSQRRRPEAPAVSGCYRVDMGEWSRPLGPDAAYHAIPAVIRLDTVPDATSGWRASPDIAFPQPSEERWVPRWTAKADSVEVMWSNGYLVTRLDLWRSSPAELRGVAIAESDAMEEGAALPRARVVARRVACTAVD